MNHSSTESKVAGQTAMTPWASWWHTEGDRVVCDLCPRECRMGEGQRGFCFVRQNVGGRMELTTYGLSTGFCIDPIEKKPLNHFLPGTPVLSFGTAGCNLGCKFCQNWSISKAREVEKLSDQASPEAIAQAALQHGCRSVAFTYNDPVIWAEYAIDTARCCREMGIKTVAVTAGYICPDARQEFYSVMDAANVDLKAFSETFYKYLTFSKLEPVLDTLRWLKRETDVWFEITDLIIPEENDSPEEIAKMCDWIVENLGQDVPLHFTAFHPDFRMLDKPRTPPETLIRARQQAIDAGIRYAYVGNVNDVEHQSTYCHQCGTLLIQRDWHQLGIYSLAGESCANCGVRIPGVFESRPGNWGNKRLPIRISQTGPKVTSNDEPQIHTIGVPSSQSRQPSEVDSMISHAKKSDSESPSEQNGPKIEFSEEESKLLSRFTRSVVEANVQGNRNVMDLPEELAKAPGFGVFVSLKRMGMLRACRGQWGKSYELGQLLANSAGDSALRDTRFPSICADELDLLEIEISLMFDAKQINARGEDRLGQVEIGRHGLVIEHRNGRGLLLPQVATEAKWDSRTFLEHVCNKAGLPPGTWREDAAELMTFQARLMHSPPTVAEFDARTLDPAICDRMLEIANLTMLGQTVESSGESGVFSDLHEEPLGLFVRTAAGNHSLSMGPRRCLLDLTRSAALALRRKLESQGRTNERIDYLTGLWQPVSLLASDYPHRHQTLARSAVLSQMNGRWALAMASATNPDPVGEALTRIRVSSIDWQYDQSSSISLTAFSTWHHQRPQAVPASSLQPPASSLQADSVRLTSRAGQFYPDEEAEITREIERFLAEGKKGIPKASFRAVMLPHAGWSFCGSVIGKTLARLEVPKTVIVLSPKHTPYGAHWSVSPADWWQFPGSSIPIASELRTRLRDLVPSLECEPKAHQLEHGVEVLVPFLRQLNPELHLLPIVLGPSEREQTLELSTALAKLLAEETDPPLLVISSDMNHFAAEPENRRLDHLALDAMLTGDPQHLFETVRSNDISMCGMIPAVTVMQALLKDSKPLSLELVDYTNSGQVTGEMNSVVGYAGMLLN